MQYARVTKLTLSSNLKTVQWKSQSGMVLKVIPALRRKTQEDYEFRGGLEYIEFQASMNYIARHCLKN